MKIHALPQPFLSFGAGARGKRIYKPLQIAGSGDAGRSAATASLVLATVLAPLGLVLACEAAGFSALGYTRSLLLFFVPAAVGTAWLFGDSRVQLSIQWPALANTVGLWTGIGWLLDLTLAASFFRFPEQSAVCGIALPGLDLASGGLVPVPIEEFVFYLLGFLVAIVIYSWFERRTVPLSQDPGARKTCSPNPRIHVPTLAVGGLALLVAWFSKGGLPGYALFLVLAGVFPNAWLLPMAWTRVNKNALGSTMAVLFVLAAIWEVGLALPNGWWAYNEQHMAAFVETPWCRLPMEAIAVWVLWPFTTIVTYEALRGASERTPRRAPPRLASSRNYPERTTTRIQVMNSSHAYQQPACGDALGGQQPRCTSQANSPTKALQRTIVSFSPPTTRVLLSAALCSFLAVPALAQPGPGFSLRFDGSGNYVAAPHTPGLNAFPFTVTAWVKTAQTSGQQGLLNKYVAASFDGWNVFLLDGRVRAWYFVNGVGSVWGGSNGLDGGSIADGAWHHIAFVVDATAGWLYVDGVLRAGLGWSGTPAATTTVQEIRFGSYPGGGVPFEGLLDDISIWRVALSPAQVQATMLAPPAGAEADLLAFYRCDEASGTTVADTAPLDGNNTADWVGTPLFFPSVVAFQANNEGDWPPRDCSSVPSSTEVKLDFRGVNLVGCKVDLVSTASRIHRVASDCTTSFYADLPPYVPRQWTILSQPPGANAQIEVSANSPTLSLPVAGDYLVQLTVCPGGNCPVYPFPGSSNTFSLTTSTGTLLVRAETELPLRVHERPVLPPSAMKQSTNLLNLTDEQRSCMCQGGGGFIDPQWVTVTNWSGPNDYKRLEGYVVRSWPSITDGPFNHSIAYLPPFPTAASWYVIHDINVIVSPDPPYYNLLSTKPEWENDPHLLGCEAEGNKVPERFRPVEGDRVSLFGFWILDCGHPPFYTEIHPVVGWAVHRNRPVRIPDLATFTFDLVTNTVVSTAGNDLYVPGIITDLWFNSDTGAITEGDNSSLAHPARCNPDYPQGCVPNFPCPPYLDADNNITQSPIRREYEFNIYLPKNPSQVFAEIGQVRPPAPLYTNISNPHLSPGPDPILTLKTETTNGVTYQYLHVYLDLRLYDFSSYSRRIEAAWVYPKPDNWGLAQWRVALHRLDVFNDLDSKARWPGSDGDWILWMMLPGASQPWTRILDGFNNTHGAMIFDPPWQTGDSDPAFQRPPLNLDPQHRLGPDILSFSRYINFWMGGYEADEGFDDDPGRISGFVFNPGTLETWQSHNGNFSATLSLQHLATFDNGTLSPAAAELGRHYLLACTNKINNRSPVRDHLGPLDLVGLVAEGVSGETPWSPIDPRQIYGAGAALMGDLNRDGFPDVALGTHGSNVAAHVFLGGRNGFSPAPHAIVSVPLPEGGGAPGQRSRTFAAASDVNGDAIADLLIGTPAATSGQTNEGTVHIFSGADLAAGRTLVASNAIWSAEGNFPNALFGSSIAAGDINRDGISDVVVGAPTYQNSIQASRPLGRVMVYFGSPLGPPATPNQTLVPATLFGSEHWFGYSVSMAGDVNGDGYTDVVIGAPRYTNPEIDEGAFYLFYGSVTGLVVNTPLLLESNVASAQFGHTVAGAGDPDADGFGDVLVSAPYYSGDELHLENGYVSLFRGSPGGLIASPWWIKTGATAGAHFGLDLGPVGDMNGDGHMDIAIAAPGETGPDGMTGNVAYYLGTPDNALQNAETWRTWGVNRVASLMINSPCCVPYISPCCNVGSTNKVDFNRDGFADPLVLDATGAGDPFARVQLVLGRGQKAIVPALERFYRAGAAEPYAFPDIVARASVADLVSSGQTNLAKLEEVLAKVQDLYFTLEQSTALVPMLQQLQQIVPTNLFDQYFGEVELDLGTAFYIDCGAANAYTDALNRRWVPDAPFLATANTGISTFAIGPITNALTGDNYLPDAMLNSERWFNGHIRYQVAVPNGWYTVLLYFSENFPSTVNPALGGTGCPTCARIFDLEVEGQRVNAYNPADAALPPDGDGLGAVYTATQIPFNVQVMDGLLDVAVLDHGFGNPPADSAIKGMAILGRPDPAIKFASRPRIASITRNNAQLGLLVDLHANLARFLSGQIPLRLQSSTNLEQWATLSELPEIRADGAYFSLFESTNNASFYRTVITSPSHN